MANYLLICHGIKVLDEEMSQMLINSKQSQSKTKDGVRHRVPNKTNVVKLWEMQRVNTKHLAKMKQDNIWLTIRETESLYSFFLGALICLNRVHNIWVMLIYLTCFITPARKHVTSDVQQHTTSSNFLPHLTNFQTQTYNTLTNIYVDETMHHIF